ncbi:hypothetical protein ACTXT7_012758, partial [Hymenolepis weldensis]
YSNPLERHLNKSVYIHTAYISPRQIPNTLFQLHMNNFLLVCLFFLASIAAAQQQVDQNTARMGYLTSMPTEAFYRQQRISLMDNKRNLITMINQLRDVIFKQQMLMNQYHRYQPSTQQQQPVTE